MNVRRSHSYLIRATFWPMAGSTPFTGVRTQLQRTQWLLILSIGAKSRSYSRRLPSIVDQYTFEIRFLLARRPPRKSKPSSRGHSTAQTAAFENVHRRETTL